MATLDPIKDFPPISESLIFCLERRFNCGPPMKDEALSSLYLRAGHAEVVAYLRSIQDKQNTGLSKESTDVFLQSEDSVTPSETTNPSSRRRSRRSNSG